MEETEDLKEPGTGPEIPAQAPETQESGSEQEPGQKLAEAEKQVQQYKDLLLRKVAEFDNFKKRVENESASVVRYAKADLLQNLLPIIDDFERSLKLSRNRRESEAFTQGIEMIYQKLMKFLEFQGVKEIESLGKEFDVHYHDALLQVPKKDVPPQTVIDVVEKGYMLADRVLRHAKVVVSTGPNSQEKSNGTEGEPGQQDSGANQPMENRN